MGKYNPTTTVTDLAVKRSGDNFTASWKVPSAAKDQNKDNRMSGVEVLFSDGTSTKTVRNSVDHEDATATYKDISGETLTQHSNRLAANDSYGTGHMPLGPAYVRVKVRGYHKHGDTRHYGPWCNVVQYSLDKPAKPVVESSYDVATRTITFTIKSASTDDGAAHWVKTGVVVTVTGIDGNPVARLASSYYTTMTEKSHSIDISSLIGGIQPGNVVRASVTALAEGAGGSSGNVTATRGVAYPGRPVIKSVTATSKQPKGVVTVAKKSVGAYANHIQLQRCVGADPNAAGSWSDVPNQADDGDMRSLTDVVGNFWSGGGGAAHRDEHVYYRLVSSRDGFPPVPSNYVEATDLYTPPLDTSCNAVIQIGAIKFEYGETYADVDVHFKDSEHENSGTELSWSDWSYAWQSETNKPNVVDREGNGSASTERSGCDRKHSLRITGLESGVTYYMRARRYRVVEGQRYYSGYSEKVEFKFYIDVRAFTRSSTVTRVEPLRLGDGAILSVSMDVARSISGVELSWAENPSAWDVGGDVDATAVQMVRDAGSFSFDATIGAGVDGKHLVPGKTYYARARAYFVDGETVYGYHSAARVFTTNSASTSRCDITYCQTDPNGLGATLVIGHDDDASTATLVEWSDDEHAWQSTERPKSADADWADDGASKSAQWAKTQSVYIRGLELGKVYYVKAARYSDVGGERQVSGISVMRAFNTVAATATDDSCAIISMTPDEYSTGAYVVVGWNENSANDGTELTWSQNVDAWESSQQPSSLQATWRDAESREPGYMGTQVIHVRNLTPGTMLHARARRFESQAGTYSPYSDTASVAIPSVATSYGMLCGIVSAEGVGPDSARVVIGWSGDHTGCEVTWSDDANAWESSQQPSSCDVTWEDGQNQSAFPTSDTEVDASKAYYTRSGSGTSSDPYVYARVANPTAAGLPTYYEFAWLGTSTLYIGELTQGTTYHIRARSYYDADPKVYSGMCDPVDVTPITAPDSVSLVGPPAVARGEAIELLWAVGHELDQVEWHCYLAEDGATLMEGAPMADGEGSACHATIGPEVYGDEETLALQVRAGCGGDMTESNVVNVGIVSAPSCECSCDPVLASRPASVTAYTDDPSALLSVTCSSMGVSYERPDGAGGQLAGDTVWTSLASPEWEAVTWGETQLRSQLAQAVTDAQDAYDAAHAAAQEDPSDEELAIAEANALTALGDAQAALDAHPADGDVYAAAVEVPADLVDGSSYEVRASASERMAGLSSAAATCSFDVEWSHQAPTPPSCAISVDVGSRSVTLSVPRADGWVDGDSYDVYRATQTGHELVASGVEPGQEVTDPYAPFGDSHYRIACTTADGDVAFDDFGYSLPVRALRFDWGDGYVELPYNIETSDAYEKSFEAREHVDGSVSGYYDKAVRRTGSYKVNVVKADSETISDLRRLGEHAGAVFCRTSQGDAFQCNADLGGLDMSYATMAAGVTFPLTAVRLTGEFMADVEGEEE